jgi:hypothetical protein
MLLVAEYEDPRLEPLSWGARSAWLRTVGYCSSHHSDIVPPAMVAETGDPIVREWEHSGLAARLPFGNLRVLARGSLWDFDPTERWF